MIKGIAAAAGVMVALTLAPVSAHAADVTSSCDPATRPASVTRVEHRTDGLITTRVSVTHTKSQCISFLHGWVVMDQHVREWKRFSRDATHSCQVRARTRDGWARWSDWHVVPWASSTNC